MYFRQVTQRALSCLISIVAVVATRGLDPSSRLRWITAILRRFPYWIPGHLEVAKLQLDLGAVRAGYSASTLVLASSIATSDQRRKACSLLGRSFLAAGRPEDALTAFGYPGRALEVNDLEDIAAALMVLERYAEAQEILLRKPRHQLSQPGVAALEFLQSKLSG